jgi:AcrR family transcriptional regulator
MCAKDNRRAEILRAAFEAFAERGYDKTSMDDIVRRCGLSKGTLYWHFKNKHDLLIATINMAMGGIRQSMEAIMNQDAPAGERLRRMFIETSDSFLEDPNLIGLLANFFFQSSQSPEAQHVMRSAYDIFVSLLEQLIQEGIDSGEFRPVDARMAAIMLIGAGDGIVFQALLKLEWDAALVMNTFLDLALRGLQKERSDI